MSDDPAARVLAELRALDDDLVAFLRRLVAVPSVNPGYVGVRPGQYVGEESRAARTLAEVYAAAGATVHTVAVDPARANTVGVVEGRGGGRSLAFNGHVDVVPPGPEPDWTHPPFAGVVAGGRMYGRGTVDQKAGLAGQAFAALALARAGVRLAGDLQLHAVVGEETGEHRIGTDAVLDRLPRTDAAVVSEPSPTDAGTVGVGVVSAGVTRFEVVVDGRRGHGTTRSAYLEPGAHRRGHGVNAIDKGFLVYQALRDLESRWRREKTHDRFPTGYFALSPAVVHGGARDHPVGSIVPDRFTLAYSLLLHPGGPVDEVRAEVERHLTETADRDDWLREHPPEVHWDDFHWPPLADPANAAIAGCVRDAARSAGTTPPDAPGDTHCTGVSDASLFQQRGVPTVTFGPGSGRGHACTAHATDEFVDLDQLRLATRTYALTALHWCGVA